MAQAQDAMKKKLEALGVPFKAIDVYGNQIVVTTVSRDSADKWAMLLQKFATLRGVIASVDEAQDNKGTCLCPTVTPVFRTFAAIC